MQINTRVYTIFLPVVLSVFVLASCTSIEDTDKTGQNLTAVEQSSATTKSKRDTSAPQAENGSTNTNDRQILMHTEFDSYPSNVNVIKLFLECNDGKEFGFDAH